MSFSSRTRVPVLDHLGPVCNSSRSSFAALLFHTLGEAGAQPGAGFASGFVKGSDVGGLHEQAP